MYMTPTTYTEAFVSSDTIYSTGKLNTWANVLLAIILTHKNSIAYDLIQENIPEYIKKTGMRNYVPNNWPY